MSNSIEIIEDEPVNRGKITAITGFSGPGYIGNNALMFIARNKGYRLKAHVKSNLIPPMTLLIDGKPTPSFRIYGDNKGELLIVLCETMISGENAWAIGKKLMEWLKEKGVNKIISVEGMPFGTSTGETIVFGYSTKGQDLTTFGVRQTPEGAVSGLNAVLLEESSKHGVRWISLFPTTSMMTTIDYKGAAAVVEVLNRMFKLDVDATPIKKRDEMVKQIIQKRRRASGGFWGFLRRK